MSVLHSNLLRKQRKAAKGFEMLKEISRFAVVGILLYWVASKIKTNPNLNIWQIIGFLIVLFIAYLILEIPRTKEKNEIRLLNNDDDIFLDNAPNPTPPPTNPPTSEQVEFAEFMRKQREREQEREKSVVRKE